jgi:hypothetical protein
MENLVVQVLWLIAITFVTAFGVLLPHWLKSVDDAKAPAYLAITHSLVGGVFVNEFLVAAVPSH